MYRKINLILFAYYICISVAELAYSGYILYDEGLKALNENSNQMVAFLAILIFTLVPVISSLLHYYHTKKAKSSSHSFFIFTSVVATVALNIFALLMVYILITKMHVSEGGLALLAYMFIIGILWGVSILAGIFSVINTPKVSTHKSTDNLTV